jgi:hypothetical protein
MKRQLNGGVCGFYNTSDEIAIHTNDQTDIMYEKLLAIYQIPPDNDYQIILPDKPLKKSFDPDSTRIWPIMMNGLLIFRKASVQIKLEGLP